MKANPPPIEQVFQKEASWLTAKVRKLPRLVRDFRHFSYDDRQAILKAVYVLNKALDNV